MENGSSGSPPAAAASCPPWVMLNHLVHRDSIVSEGTAAAATTSTNLLFYVSLLVAAPPASSSIYYGLLDHSASGQDEQQQEEEIDSLRFIAADADVVLLEVRSSSRKHRYYDTECLDYFLYETGTARLPSLLKLPACYDDNERQCFMNIAECDTGLLRSGEDDELLLVAQIEVFRCNDKLKDRAELSVLRVGQAWELWRAVPIISGDHGGSTSNVAMPRRWQADRVVPVGGRYLCWVDYLLSFLFCDMANADASLIKLRYVTLPVAPPESADYCDYGRLYKRCCRDLAVAGAGAVRFVNIEPCRCGGGRGRTTCARGKVFTVTTWTLNLSMDGPLEWTKDGVLDCGELWAVPTYKGLPQVTVNFPIVSLDNPDVIWFVVPAEDAGRRVWIIEVDTRSKALLSVVPYTDRWMLNSHVAAKLRC